MQPVNALKKPAIASGWSLGLLVLIALLSLPPVAAENGRFEGAFFRGAGDVEYLRLLDTARRMFAPDPEFENLSMLYMPGWNGLVEGPTWDAWWIQNSYGTTYGMLPFLEEPFVTFLQNSQDLWFDQMGDGKRVGAAPPFNWVAPDGCLCDCARPGWIVYRQGDGRPQIHDWAMEFTAAGLLMQSELLLISRDQAAIARYVLKLERCANFIETRRDPTNNLFLAGPAGNLLAPSYAGWKKPDGTYGQAYLTGLSVTYIAALDRLIELEKLAGRAEQVTLQTRRRDDARKGLAHVTTEEGYFIRSLDPDGTRHGVFGAAQHGYFEASPNHDAIAFRVVDRAQAERIFDKIASIPGLRPHDFILPNYPSYDDMYEKPEGLWAFGTWVNGGHWSTCEARMMLGYYRLGKFDDARRSMRQLLGFAERFRMDNPLVKFGSDVYQPNQPINLTDDAFGPPAAFVRGLFEYLYRADGLTLLPHIPPGITRLEQRFPIRFGTKQLFLATVGAGPITAVTLNGKSWTRFDRQAVFLPYEQVPERAVVEVVLGDVQPLGFQAPASDNALAPVPPADNVWLRLKKTNLTRNDRPLRIGADSDGGNRFRGDMAQALVFSRALSADEIAALSRREPGSLTNDLALVGDWAFDRDEDGSFSSSAGVHLRAKIVGGVGLTNASAGPALRLNGSGYLEIAPNPALDLTNACTLAAWICPANLPPGGGRIIDKSEVGTANGYLLDTYPRNSLRLITQAGTLSYAAKLVPGRWVHVAATVAPDGSLALYLDGKAVARHSGSPMPDVTALVATAGRLRKFHRLLVEHGLGNSYEAAHARLALASLATAHQRLALLGNGRLTPLAQPVSETAADFLYLDTARKLTDGLERVLEAYGASTDARKQKLAALWRQCAAGSIRWRHRSGRSAGCGCCDRATARDGFLRGRSKRLQSSLGLRGRVARRLEDNVMNYDEFAFFNQQLAGMLTSGIPLEGALRQLCETMQAGELRSELEALGADLAKGVPLREALPRRSLPKFYVEMVQVGAQSNDLPGVLTMVADHYQRAASLWGRLKALMVYPVWVYLAMLAVFLFLGWLVLNLSRTWTETGLATLGSGRINLTPWLAMLPAAWLILFGVVFLAVILAPGGRAWLRRKLPGFREANLARFASSMELLLHGGSPPPTRRSFIGSRFREYFAASANRRTTRPPTSANAWRRTSEAGRPCISRTAMV